MFNCVYNLDQTNVGFQLAYYFYELIVVGTSTVVILYISQTTRYYAKFISYMVGMAILFGFIAPFGLLRYPIKDHRIALLPAYGSQLLLALLGVTYEVRGHNNIDRNKGGVVIINHQSCIDVVALGYLWPMIGRASVVIKKVVLYAFPYCIGVWLWGSLFIDRSSPSDAYNRLNKECDAIEKQNQKILIFPEGTRSHQKRLLPFKKGAFHLAIESQSMVQPVVVSRYHFLNLEQKYFERGHNIISILPEISCKGLTKNDLPQLIEQTQNLMQQHYDEISKESELINNHLIIY